MTSTDIRITIGIMTADIRITFGIMTTDIRITFGIMSTDIRITFGIMTTDITITFGIMTTDIRITFGIMTTDTFFSMDYCFKTGPTDIQPIGFQTCNKIWTSSRSAYTEYIAALSNIWTKYCSLLIT